MSMFNLYDEKGNYITDERYKEIFKLDELLTESGIPHVFEKMMDGWVICYPNKGDCIVCDAIEHFGSYGHEQDLLELMGLLTPEEEECDSVVGWLTAENIFDRILKHFKEGEK